MDYLKPEKKENKVGMNVTIDKPLYEMVVAVKNGYGINLSNALNEILAYFKKTLWDAGEIAKTKEENESE